MEVPLGRPESFPFIDIGGKYLLSASQYPATTLQGLNFTDIANSVTANTSPVGVDINASAAALIKYLVRRHRQPTGGYLPRRGRRQRRRSPGPRRVRPPGELSPAPA